jgi:transposase
MEILDKDSIDKYILTNLSVGERGKACSKELMREVVGLILYRLKTGCQWRMLPLQQFFTTESLSWQGTYYHFREWVKDGSWSKVWIAILSAHKDKLDLSSMQLDGSHTPCKQGGEAVGYQARKKTKTTNSLFLADNQGQMLACATPQEGNHHDLFNIQSLFNELCEILSKAGIDLKGLFLNADAGFDSQELRKLCKEKQIEANIAINSRNGVSQAEEYMYFDEELYKCRTVVEHANAWMDSFKALLVRFEKKTTTWVALLLLAFSVRFLRKIKQKSKS